MIAMKDTQAQAYETSKRTIWRERVESYLVRRMRHGSTADEALEAMQREFGQAVTINSVAPRLTEMVDGGMAYDTGERRTTRSGKSAAVIRHISADDRPRTAHQPKLFECLRVA